MNILTIAFCGDLANLLYQAHSLKKNWLGEKKWYLIIEDLHYTSETLEWCQNVISPIMNDWDIKIISGRDITIQNSWYRQQVYKLWAASEIVNSEYSLILDSKNFLVRPIDGSWFFTDNKLKVQFASDNDTSTGWIDCCNFFGEPNSPIKRPSNLTPWVWRKDLVNNTISKYKDYGIEIYTTEKNKLPVYEFDAYWFCNQSQIEWTSTRFNDGVTSDIPPHAVDNMIKNHIIQSRPFWTYHRHFSHKSDLYKISNNYLKSLDIIDDNLIQSWINICNCQMLKWPNLMVR
jgi:hypothetical protein